MVELAGEVVDDGVAGVEFFLEVVEFLGAVVEGGLLCGEVVVVVVEFFLEGECLLVDVCEFCVQLVEGVFVFFVLVEALCEEYF